jgi:phospholipase/carboxylesterase
MHGLGADGNDFVPIVPELELPAHANVRFIFPHAPYRPISINMGYVMRGWYDIFELDSLQREDESGLRESWAYIEALIQSQIDAGIGARRIVLAGFSQGCALALFTGLRYTQALAGIVALSGYLPLQRALADEAHPANVATPIFMAHGTDDNVVPLRLGQLTRETLAKHGYDIRWHEYPMPHSVCQQEIAEIGAFLRQVLL